MAIMTWSARICVLFLLVPCVSTAPDSQGKEFILGYMENELPNLDTFKYSPTDIELFLTTVSETPVTVTVTTPLFDPNFNATVVVNRGTTETVKVTHAIRGVGTEKSNKGVLVTASDEISVYSVNKELKSTDAYISLPVDVLGTEYFVMTYVSKPELLVVGTEDNTQVNISCPPVATGNEVCKITYNGVDYKSGQTLTVTLNKYETFHALGENWKRADFTGVHIVSDKPVSVVSGNKKVSVQGSQNNNSADHLTEMLMPVDTWGKSFIMISTPDRSVGDIYRIVASEDNTVVTLYNGTAFHINKTGQFLELDVRTGYYQTLTSDKPIMVGLFAKTWRGLDDGPNYGDPAMSIIIPEPQYASDYTWSSVRDPKNNAFNNKVSVVIKKNKVAGLRLDGSKNIRWREQKEVLGSPDIVHLWTNVSDGSHTLLHEDPIVTFMALVSGTYRVNSYAYLAGLRLARINAECTNTVPVPGDIIDNDCDGRIDEEKLNGIDDDGDGAVDEDLSTYSKGTETCGVTGDPHLLTFKGKRSSVPIPCIVYNVATLRINDVQQADTPTFNKSVIEVEVLARNGELPLRGQYFVSDLSVKITLIEVQDNGTESRGAEGTFTTGHQQIHDHRLDSNVAIWDAEADLELQTRVITGYDVTNNMALLSIKGASPKIQFRPVNRSEGIPQTLRPGLTVEVGGDVIADARALFPNTLCSTLEDNASPRTRAANAGFPEKFAGLYSVLSQNTEQMLEGKYLPCYEVKGYYDDCSNKTAALTQCSPLLSQPHVVSCLTTKAKVDAFGVFSKCLNYVCQKSAQDCTLLKLYAQECNDVTAALSLTC